MNDPHVEELFYRIETGDGLTFQDPPPLVDETDAFRMTLSDGVATFSMKEHHPTEQSSKQAVDGYLHCYRPHSFSELDGKVPPDVLAGLDPAGVYGGAWSGRVRVRKVSNSRREREAPDPSEWIGVPVRLNGSGPDRRIVDGARRAMEGNTRPRKVGDRFFPLAHGPLRCAHCGCRMQGFGRRGAKNPSYAYRCNSPTRKGTTCPNRHQHHADTLDWAAVDMFEEFASSARLIGLYEAAVAEHDRRLGGRSGRGTAERREALAGRLREAEDERLGYLRQDARGLLSDAELEALLSEVGGRRDAIAEELRFAEDSAEREHERKAVREALSSSYSPVHGEWYEDPDAVHPDQFLSLVAGPEKVRRTFLETGARFSVDRHGTLTLELDPLQTGGTHGNELWEFDENGLMKRRDASINDYKIVESERRIF